MFNHAGCSAQGRPGVRRKGSVARGTKSFELTNDAPTKIAQAKRGTTMGLEAEHIVKKDAHIKKKANKKTKKRSTKQAMFTQKKHEEKIKSVPVPVVQEKAVVKEEKPVLPVSAPAEQKVDPVKTPVVPALTQPVANSQELPVVDGIVGQELSDSIPMDESVIGALGAAGEYVTAEQARMYECIEQEIVSRWKPPRGLSKELACQIKCSIGGDGAVVSCILEKPSGVLIYDMAARSAARVMSLPRWAWGKEFTIVFKQ